MIDGEYNNEIICVWQMKRNDFISIISQPKAEPNNSTLERAGKENDNRNEERES